MAAETAAHGPSAGEYIQHHLHHLQKNFSFENVTQKNIIDFSLFNADSVFWSILLGALACWLLWLGVLFILLVYFFPAGIAGTLMGKGAAK